MRVGKHSSPFCQSIDIWSQGLRMSAQAPNPVVLIVNGDHKDVWLIGGSQRANDGIQKEESKRNELHCPWCSVKFGVELFSEFPNPVRQGLGDVFCLPGIDLMVIKLDMRDLAIAGMANQAEAVGADRLGPTPIGNGHSCWRGGIIQIGPQRRSCQPFGRL